MALEDFDNTRQKGGRVMFCGNCGNEIKSGEKFCKNCGARLDDVLHENEITVESNNSENEPIVSEEINSVKEGVNTESSVSETVDEQYSTLAAENTTTQEINEDNVTNVDKTNNKKKFFLIGGIVAAILAVVIVIFATKPSIENISAEYSGATSAGTVIDANSDITVTAIYDDGSEKTIDGGWSIVGGELNVGSNSYEIEYGGKTCDLNIYSPLMEDGKIVATKEEIENEFKKNAESKTDWFEGFGEEETFGKEIVGLDSSCKAYLGGNRSKKEISDDEIPNTILLTTYFDLDSGNIDKFNEIAALVLYSIDPTLEWDDAKETMDTETAKAVKQYKKKLDNQEDSYVYENNLENEKFVMGFLPAGNQLMILSSFQELK